MKPSWGTLDLHWAADSRGLHLPTPAPLLQSWSCAHGSHSRWALQEPLIFGASTCAGMKFRALQRPPMCKLAQPSIALWMKCHKPFFYVNRAAHAPAVCLKAN